MMTRVYRVARVLAGPSAVARIDAVDAEGHELRLEIPTGEALSAAAGRVLVLQWSLHDLPAALAPEAAQAERQAVGPEMALQGERPAAAPEMMAASEATGRSVDADFMALMARSGRGAPAQPSISGSPPTGAAERGADRDIQDEFNMLLGSARTKGQQ